jgi:hypothetical protein
MKAREGHGLPLNSPDIYSPVDFLSIELSQGNERQGNNGPYPSANSKCRQAHLEKIGFNSLLIFAGQSFLSVMMALAGARWHRNSISHGNQVPATAG